jgi:methylated-DNA-protein-cysteine methyltransferase related protein
VSAGGNDSLSFRERVYVVVLQIPSGCVTTYGAIAHHLGAPKSARMVGWAMASCPDNVSEMAHRVVNRHGELSGGWSWGHPDVMQAILEDEGVTFIADHRVDLKRHFWHPDSLDDADECGVILAPKRGRSNFNECARRS